MAITALHWVWQWIGAERRSDVRVQRDAPPPMKIEVEPLPDYQWRALGFAAAIRRDETDRRR